MPDKWREITQEEEADIERHVNRIMRRIASARISVEDVLSEIDVMNLARREQRAVLRRVNEILSELDADLAEEARATVEDTYEHGRALALVALGTFATVGAAKRHLRKQGKGNVHKSFISDEAESLTDDLLAATANTRRHEIGRASCRERVEISVGGESSDKQRQERDEEQCKMRH